MSRGYDLNHTSFPSIHCGIPCDQHISFQQQKEQRFGGLLDLTNLKLIIAKSLENEKRKRGRTRV